MMIVNEMHVDGQSIGIFKDKETSAFVDYFFEADFRSKDPRFQSRLMKVGTCRGLFRIDKVTLVAELLFPMPGDDSDSRFDKASTKVLKKFRTTGRWPDGTQFASG